jgi:hypothetical protein
MKFYWTSLVAAGIALTSFSAYAGARWYWGVFINKSDDGSGNFGGTLGATRNWADPNPYLGCYYYTTSASGSSFGPPGWKWAYCYGYNGTQFATCTTTDPTLMDTISKLQGDSYVFVAFDTGGTCNEVDIGAQSAAPPKAL